MTDMRETMGAVFDRLNPVETPVSREMPVEATPVETNGAAPEVQQETTPTEASPTRGPDGRFLPKTETQTVEPETAPATLKTTAEPATETPAAAALPPSAPASRSAAAKADWAKLPPAIQQEVLKREQDVSKGFAERADTVKAYENIERAIGPRKQQLVAQYGSVEAGLDNLLQLSEFAARDLVGFIRMLAQNRGLDLAQLQPQPTTPQPQAEDAGWVDPQLHAVQQELAGLKQTITQREQAEQAQRMEQTRATVEAFKASGKAPHFEDVRQDMAGLARLHPQMTIEQLYDRAVYANPTTRERMLAEQRAAQDKAAADERARKAAEAQRMGRLNVTTKGAAGASPVTPESRYETMERVYDSLNPA